MKDYNLKRQYDKKYQKCCTQYQVLHFAARQTFMNHKVALYLKWSKIPVVRLMVFYKQVLKMVHNT